MWTLLLVNYSTELFYNIPLFMLMLSKTKSFQANKKKISETSSTLPLRTALNRAYMHYIVQTIRNQKKK